jgi:hypothetical protein
MPNIAITLPQLMYYAVGDKVRRERRWTSAECNSRPRICSLDRRSCVLSDQKAEREIACSQSSKDVAKVIGKYEPILSGAGRPGLSGRCTVAPTRLELN